MAAPLSFFDVTPRGRVLSRYRRETACVAGPVPEGGGCLLARRVLSRFSREMLTVDVSLPSALQTYLSTLASVGTT